MTAVDVLNSAGEKVSVKDLPEEIFNIPVKSSVLHEVVRMQLAKRRRGTACTKTRGEVSGSTRKLFRQKGTGNARAGSIKSPLRRGGGVIFGPTQRSYEFSVPKKVRRLALKMALSSKLEEQKLFIINDFNLQEIKTQSFVKVLNALGLGNILIVSDSDDANLILSSRNVSDVKIIKTEGLNVYDILKFDNLLLLESSIENIEGRLS